MAQEKISRPNILIAIADDWSFGHASAYGCRWVQTPGFDRVAREGLLFNRAYTPNAKCAPSRSCLLTGRNSWQLKDACNHMCFFPPEFTSFMEAFGSNGYTTGHTTKGWGPGIARTKDGKPREMTGKAFNARKLKPNFSGIGNSDYAANFEDFLATTEKEKPWCFWYGAVEPHRGYEYGSGVKSGKKLTQIDRVPGYWPDDEIVRNDLLDYAVEIEHFDRHLEKMLTTLEKNGQLANTLIIVTSDHGMPFPRAKGQCYEASNHVPLAIMWKDGIRQPGRTVEDYVSFIDLAPTLLDCARFPWSKSGLAPTPGHSLRPLFQSDKSGQIDAERDHVLIGKERHDVGRPDDVGYPIRGIVKENWLYLKNYETDRWPVGNPETGYPNCDAGATKSLVLDLRRNGKNTSSWKFCFGKRPSEELYDLSKDPDCLTNLASEPTNQPRLTKLREQMESELKEQEDPRMFGKGAEFDKIPYTAEATRDYFNRLLRGEKVVAGWIKESDRETMPIKE
jgi:arylsulfatase A-like enzyme